MAREGIVEAADCGGRRPVGTTVCQTSSLLSVLKNVSIMALSKQFPLPDVEVKTPFFLCSAWSSNSFFVAAAKGQ